MKLLSVMTQKKKGQYWALLFTTILGVVFSLGSCSEQAEIKSHLKDIGIKLNDKIVVNKFQPSGFTNFVLTIELEVSEQDKQSIIQLIQKDKNFNSNLPSDSYASNNWTKSFYNDSTYHLIVRKPTKNAFKEHDLQLFYKTNIVKYNYLEE